jgi:hypothetical protein
VPPTRKSFAGFAADLRTEPAACQVSIDKQTNLPLCPRLTIDFLGAPDHQVDPEIDKSFWLTVPRYSSVIGVQHDVR